ncbi:molecular chaperone DnaK suppressor DksA [Helicobacter monodelphidis]|uniref:RNA polymerase-binding protein DksA n=1 Tax=Helicobacter sp. 15-1451 TaxID=2004995 RepID=UPI000DCB90C6|nr:RNA polymerase-binding protein DksA [Helicobacter sp. 15-1451]RAX58581.1 molecular chaperone DnaK suppressor DksA [Helicobacter sp. 15-1451]
MTNIQREEFKEILLKRKEQLQDSFANHVNEMDALKHQKMSDEIDYANASMQNLVGNSISLHHKKEYDDIEIALMKIEEGEYGICEMCGEEIRIDRLKVKPHAKYCIICREFIEKEGRK